MGRIPGGESRIAVNPGQGVQAAYPLRPKKNIWVTLTSLALAVLAIGGLFAIITVLGQPGSSGDQARGEDPTIPLESNKEASASTDTLAQRAPDPTPLPPIDEQPQFFSLRQMEVTWSKVNGYLVRLEVRTPLRNRVISGLIVDSRGWVVTSLSGLQDAGEVSVKLAGKNLGDDPPFREIVDLSRGIIAEDPTHDLALISINRAQVINLADIELLSTGNVVEAQRFMIARTPPPRHLRWLAECRIANRGTIDELPAAVRTQLQSFPLPADDTTQWLVYPPLPSSSLSEELAGSPLINDQGTVVAINTGAKTDDSAIAVPASLVQSLIDSIDSQTPQIKPFARAAELLQQGTTETGPSQGSRGQAFRETLQNLMSDADACRKTDWSADNATEFAAMQSLSRNLSDAYDWVAQNPPDNDDVHKDQEMLDQAVEQITMSLQDDLIRAEFLAGKGNEFFFQQVTTENPWFVIAVKVSLDQFNSPPVANQETIAFELLGSGKHVLAAAGPDARTFRAGRRFLLIGRLAEMGPISSSLFEGQPRIPLVNVHANVEITIQGGPRRP